VKPKEKDRGVKEQEGKRKKKKKRGEKGKTTEKKEEQHISCHLPSPAAKRVKKKENRSTGGHNHCAATPPFLFLPIATAATPP
jgi:hypothetical protein